MVSRYRNKSIFYANVIVFAIFVEMILSSRSDGNNLGDTQGSTKAIEIYLNVPKGICVFYFF